jgi:hypothetical protein
MKNKFRKSNEKLFEETINFNVHEKKNENKKRKNSLRKPSS